MNTLNPGLQDRELVYYTSVTRAFREQKISTYIWKTGNVGSFPIIPLRFQNVEKLEACYIFTKHFRYKKRRNPHMSCMDTVYAYGKTQCVLRDFEKTTTVLFPKGAWSSNHFFSGAMLDFRGLLRVVSNIFLFSPVFKDDFQFDYITCFRWVETTNQETTWKIYQKTWQVPGLKGFQVKWNKNIHQHLQRDAN